MLPVSAWPPGPPGAPLSPFGRPRTVNLAAHPRGYVLPKGTWVVQTGANRVVMFRPNVDEYLWNNPPRTPGTGILPGQGPGYGPRPPSGGPPREPVYRVRAQIRPNPWPAQQRDARRNGIDPNAQSIAETAALMATAEGSRSPATPFSPQKNFDEPWRRPPPYRFWKHNEYVMAWREWQRRIGRTDPPIRPFPGRRLPNFWGWSFTRAPGTTLIPFSSGGTVHADGQNVVIAGAGFANITQAFSV